MKIRNVSKLGDLDIPGVGIVKAGETFEVVGDAAEPYLDQPGNFVHVVQHKDGSETDAPRVVDAPADGEVRTLYLHGDGTGVALPPLPESAYGPDSVPLDPPAGEVADLTKES